MSIRVTLDRVLLDRRMSLTELSERVGVTLANLSILKTGKAKAVRFSTCLLYTSPSPRDRTRSRMPSSA